MRTRIEAMLSPRAEEPKKKPSIYERIAAPDVTALAGLSPNVSRRFVSRVQPILMNGCALAGCHGPKSSNGFQLVRVRLNGGNRRGVSERNLAATLRFVNVQNASRSPLLTTPMGNHGRRGKAVFRGRGGARQLEELRSWVREVVTDIGTDGTKPAPAEAGRVAKPISGRTQTGTQSGFGVRNPGPRYQATPAMKAARARTRKRPVAGRNLPRTSRRASSGDPFDPAEFNRRSGRSAPPTPPSRPPRPIR